MIDNEETYGTRWAATYDTMIAETMGDAPAHEAADALATLARATGAAEPTVLELGVGTGRVAVPLAERGIRVHGVDLEPAMLEILADKAQHVGDRLTHAVGDMTVAADLVAPDGTAAYDLVYCVFNTLGSLADGAAQRACLAAAATVLADHGRLVVEAPVPRLDTFSRAGRRTAHLGRRGDGVWLETARHDPVEQVISLESIILSEKDGVRIQPVHYRYTWPTELDLMAELGGLRRISRHGGWADEPFTAATVSYVAQYARPRG
ncbi:class I SAM-dependent DNA methyltransferase [Streptomyces catenulae]|uniref:Class I SAM-dependent methyltransferase n=1 Tax=Streptomyces catenulae TaxID=66875 RepID=A0ABV2Z3X0_9ACTN|nr:class I SAM-dependent methyltransferase [Streptomyces catenulae]